MSALHMLSNIFSQLLAVIALGASIKSFPCTCLDKAPSELSLPACDPYLPESDCGEHGWAVCGSLGPGLSTPPRVLRIELLGT